MPIEYVIELNGKQVGDKAYDEIGEAIREAEALDEMFPDRGVHDVASRIKVNV